jgi:hypothetical protein
MQNTPELNTITQPLQILSGYTPTAQQKIKFSFRGLDLETNDNADSNPNSIGSTLQDVLSAHTATQDLLQLRQQQLEEKREESATKLKLAEIELERERLQKNTEQDTIMMIFLSFVLMCGCYGIFQITSVISNVFQPSNPQLNYSSHLKAK